MSPEESSCVRKFLSGFCCSIVGSMAADGIKGFEHKTGWINLPMTSSTRFDGLMFGQLFADRRCAACVWFDGNRSRPGIGLYRKLKI